MSVFTRSRSFNSRLLAVLVGFAGLASGCQSSRPSFSFQPLVLHPATSRAQAAPPAPVSEAAIAATVTTATPSAPQTVSTQPRSGRAAIPAIPAIPTTPVVPLAPAQLPALAAATALVAPDAVPAQAWAIASHRRPWLHRAHAPAEAGLGLTVLGILAIVVLVVALVGLAISGGSLGWIITAAIAAGVLLLAYIDPHGH